MMLGLCSMTNFRKDDLLTGSPNRADMLLPGIEFFFQSLSSWITGRPSQKRADASEEHQSRKRPRNGTNICCTQQMARYINDAVLATWGYMLADGSSLSIDYRCPKTLNFVHIAGMKTVFIVEAGCTRLTWSLSIIPWR